MWDSPHAIHNYHLGMVNKAHTKMLMCGMVCKITTSKTASISELEHVSHFGTYLGGQFIDNSSKDMGGSLALKSSTQEISRNHHGFHEGFLSHGATPVVTMAFNTSRHGPLLDNPENQGSLLMSPAIRPVSEGLLCRSRPPVTQVLAVIEAMVGISWHL